MADEEVLFEEEEKEEGPSSLPPAPPAPVEKDKGEEDEEELLFRMEEEEEQEVPPASTTVVPPTVAADEDDFFFTSAPTLPPPPSPSTLQAYCDAVAGMAGGTIPYLVYHSREKHAYSTGGTAGPNASLVSSPMFMLLLVYVLHFAAGAQVHVVAARALVSRALLGGDKEHKKKQKGLVRTIQPVLERILEMDLPVIPGGQGLIVVLQAPSGAFIVKHTGYTPNLDFMCAFCSALSITAPYFRRDVFTAALDSEELDLERARWPDQDELPKKLLD